MYYNETPCITRIVQSENRNKIDIEFSISRDSGGKSFKNGEFCGQQPFMVDVYVGDSLPQKLGKTVPFNKAILNKNIKKDRYVTYSDFWEKQELEINFKKNELTKYVSFVAVYDSSCIGAVGFDLNWAKGIKDSIFFEE